MREKYKKKCLGDCFNLHMAIKSASRQSINVDKRSKIAVCANAYWFSISLSVHQSNNTTNYGHFAHWFISSRRLKLTEQSHIIVMNWVKFSHTCNFNRLLFHVETLCEMCVYFWLAINSLLIKNNNFWYWECEVDFTKSLTSSL